MQFPGDEERLPVDVISYLRKIVTGKLPGACKSGCGGLITRCIYFIPVLLRFGVRDKLFGRFFIFKVFFELPVFASYVV